MSSQQNDDEKEKVLKIQSWAKRIKQREDEIQSWAKRISVSGDDYSKNINYVINYDVDGKSNFGDFFVAWGIAEKNLSDETKNKLKAIRTMAGGKSKRSNPTESRRTKKARKSSHRRKSIHYGRKH